MDAWCVLNGPFISFGVRQWSQEKKNWLLTNEDAFMNENKSHFSKLAVPSIPQRDAFIGQICSESQWSQMHLRLLEGGW